MQHDPRHVRHNLGDLDPVVAVKRSLGHPAYVGMAMRAAIRQHVATPRRVGMQRTVRSAMDLALRLRLALAVRLLAL